MESKSTIIQEVGLPWDFTRLEAEQTPTVVITYWTPYSWFIAFIPQIVPNTNEKRVVENPWDTAR